MEKKKARIHHSKIIEELMAKITPEEKQQTHNKMKIAAIIFEGIAAKEWTKEKFANEMGTYEDIVTRWLSGTFNFRIDKLSKIEVVLDIEIFKQLEK